MEEWVKIEGFNDIYEVSKKGIVKSLDHYVKYKDGRTRIQKGRVLKQDKGKKGYMRVTLTLEGSSKIFAVHRLVAQAFIDNPLNKPQVNHINGIKDDNRVENLEWCSNRENIIHAYSNGLIKTNRGEKHHMSKLKDNEVLLIREMYINKTSVSDISKKFNISKRSIYNIINNVTYKTI